jgi:uncharacterized RDD family membrane protein YckC
MNASTPKLPGQKELNLQPVISVAREEDNADQDTEKLLISREILFSRFLAGIIDLLFPVMLALVFALAAARLLDLRVFSVDSIGWIALFSLGFFFFNSIFFLSLSGQTPGMFLTDLRLVGEDDPEDLSLTSILLRVVFFLPSAITIIGLCWAVFDPLCRCLHDLLSRTRIERNA